MNLCVCFETTESQIHSASLHDHFQVARYFVTSELTDPMMIFNIIRQRYIICY